MTLADPSSGELKRQLAVMPNRQQLHQVARSGHRVQEQVVAVQVFAKLIRSVRRHRGQSAQRLYRLRGLVKVASACLLACLP